MSDAGRDMRSQTQAIHDVHRSLVNLDHTIGKLVRAVEQSNKFELEKLRDIRVTNQLILKNEMTGSCQHINARRFDGNPPYTMCPDCSTRIDKPTLI